MARRDPEVEGNFICKACGTSKPRSEYYKSSRDGVSAYCAECTKLKTASWSLTPRGKRSRVKANLKKYGINGDDFLDMFNAQEGKCAICPTPLLLLDKNTHVDHDHVTGIVRGLLCSHCNLMLGHAKDNPDTLRSAASYLES